MEKIDKVIQEVIDVHKDIRKYIIDGMRDTPVNIIHNPAYDCLTFEQMKYFMKGYEYCMNYTSDIVDEIFNHYSDYNYLKEL